MFTEDTLSEQNECEDGRETLHEEDKGMIVFYVYDIFQISLHVKQILPQLLLDVKYQAMSIASRSLTRWKMHWIILIV